MSEAARVYLLANLPNWLLAMSAGWAATRWAGVPAALAASMVTAWIAKDLLLYPYLRRFYHSEPAERRIVGERGIALSILQPGGFVRVHGEIWQAYVPSTIGRLPEGAHVTVRDIHGLLLVVEPSA